MPERALSVKRNDMTAKQSPQDIDALLAEAEIFAIIIKEILS
ncbi:MAG: hypothetical protein PWQ57_2603 [Desulfovibrionales bacterium]|jgi:hypothetical protein|nr:hypothetical protein [Desulfovibrionales bacterium]